MCPNIGFEEGKAKLNLSKIAWNNDELWAIQLLTEIRKLLASVLSLNELNWLCERV
tara:strand:- start:20744 stop:20911 length:168 start_codon:yes stop_codon:yes gene_type:complete